MHLFEEKLYRNEQAFGKETMPWNENCFQCIKNEIYESHFK